MIEEILKSINIVYLIAFLVSFIFTFILIKLLVYNAKGLKLIDYPDTRKTHEKGIPLVGGIAIFLPFIFFAFPIGFPIFIEPFINSQSLCLFLSVFIIFMVLTPYICFS